MSDGISALGEAGRAAEDGLERFRQGLDELHLPDIRG